MKINPIPTETTGPGTTAGRSSGTHISILLPLLLLLALPGLAQAQFEYIADNGTVTITGYTGPGGEVVIPGSINGLPVAAIGDSAFRDRITLTGIMIPDSVTSIGGQAFRNCRSLTSVTIPDSIISIGALAFWDCIGLSNVSIGKGVINIGFSAFGGCTNLNGIAVDTLNPVYRSLDGVLYNWDQATLITYPAAKAGNHEIPEGITQIGYSAFEAASGLTGVTIPDSVTTIGDSAFRYCASLTGIAIPSSVVSIGYGTFADCTSLTSVTIPDGVTDIGSYAFGNCTSLVGVTIPSSVVSIGSAAFSGCGSLTSVTIPGSVKHIEEAVFFECAALTSVTIGSGVESIGPWAFAECIALPSVTIPASVTTIYWAAFWKCANLTAVYFEGDAPEVQAEWHTDHIAVLPPFSYTPATFYYRPGTSGWGSEFDGRPTVPWGVVWGSAVRGDVNGDGVVDQNDLSLMVASRNQHAVNSEDPRDLDGDGMITVLDARILVTLFSVPGGFLHAAATPEGIALEWTENSGAMKLQSTTDLQGGTWQDVVELQSSTNVVIGTTAERMFFRLAPVE